MIEKDFNIEEIERKVCDFFGVEHSEMFKRSIGRKESNARHYLWFVLHCHYGVSNGVLAKRYKKSRRMIIYYISEVKFRLANQSEDKEVYAMLKEHI